MRSRFNRIAAPISFLVLLAWLSVAPVLVARAAPAQPSLPEQSHPPRVDVYTEKIPFGETYVRQFDAAEGDQITITARAVDGDFDPRMTLRAADGTLLAANDNAAVPDPALGARDARIEGAILPATGTYTIEVSGSQGIGGTMELSLTWFVDQMFTLRRQEVIAYQLRDPIQSELNVVDVYPYDRYLYVFDARRGDVYSLYARALSGDVDPELSVYWEDTILIDANDNHGSTDPSLGPLDARLPNLIIPRDGRYFVEVRSYANTQGSVGFTIVHVMNGALAYPGTDTALTDFIAPNEIKTYPIDVRVGDFVSLTMRARSSLLDPVVALLDDEGNVLVDNDNHGFNDADLDFFDARIKNYLITEPGRYSVRTASARGGEGEYELIVNIKRDRRLYDEDYTPPSFTGP